MKIWKKKRKENQFLFYSGFKLILSPNPDEMKHRVVVFQTWPQIRVKTRVCVIEMGRVSAANFWHSLLFPLFFHDCYKFHDIMATRGSSYFFKKKQNSVSPNEAWGRLTDSRCGVERSADLSVTTSSKPAWLRLRWTLVQFTSKVSVTPARKEMGAKSVHLFLFVSELVGQSVTRTFHRIHNLSYKTAAFQSYKQEKENDF